MNQQQIHDDFDYPPTRSFARLNEIQEKLKHRISQGEALARYEQLESECFSALGTTGGWMSMFEREIRLIMQDTDELWLYDSKAEEWAHLCGERGLALVRDGKVIAFLVETRN